MTGDGGFSFSGVFTDVATNLFASALVAAVGFAVIALRKRAARLLWPFEGKPFAVILATSSRTDTGKYIRSASGIGQIRALAVIVPTIYRAWRGKLDVSDVILSDDVTNEWRKNLVVLGGAKNNQVTRKILEQYVAARATNAEWPDIKQEESTIYWDGEAFAAAVDKSGQVSCDYGLVLRWPNHMNGHRVVVLLAGASTFGTIAASLWYTGTEQPWTKTESQRLRRTAHFVALVKAEVNSGHVGSPQLVHSRELTST